MHFGFIVLAALSPMTVELALVSSCFWRLGPWLQDTQASFYTYGPIKHIILEILGRSAAEGGGRVVFFLRDQRILEHYRSLSICPLFIKRLLDP